MEKIRNNLIPLFLLIIVLVQTRFLWGPGYFNMHDDLQFMRVYEIGKCFSDGQIPCRWSPDMAWGYGQAMFNFYSAFPYYLGAIIRMLTPLSIMATVKSLFIVSFFTAAFGMYLLASELWGKWAGLVSATLYAYAPYHSLDIYVRGALAEVFALSILPFVFLFLYRLVKKRSLGNLLGSVFSLAALATTHNISLMIFTPFIGIWVIYWLVVVRRWGALADLVLAGGLALGLSAFFLLPNIVEQSLIQKENLTQGYSDFRAHFATLRQLFLDRSWGHGPSIFGPYDDISFQIGWPHWWLAISAAFLLGLDLLRKKVSSGKLVALGAIGFGFFAAVMTHSRSAFIWESISVLAYVQFPWRFLGLVIFFFSLGAGILVTYKYKKQLGIVIILLTLGFNFAYFVPWSYSYEVRDEQKLTGLAWQLQQKAAIVDYLPYTAKYAPESEAPSSPYVTEGRADVNGYQIRSNAFSFHADVFEDSLVEVPVMYFPGWQTIVDGVKNRSDWGGDFGTIRVSLTEGSHDVRGRFEDTAPRAVGNSLTVISLVTVFFGSILKLNKKRFLWI